jgi:hemoglobin/transferrin/lactoferrin receptor protein
MKLLSLLVCSVSFFTNVFSQEIQIINKQNNSPVENVILFNPGLTVVVYSNAEGKADLSKFGKSDSIYFKHPAIEKIGLSKQDIVEMNYVLLIDKRSIIMDDIVVTASRWQEKKRDIPFMTDVIRVNSKKLSSLQTTSDILMSTGNMMVQKSQGGAGSPVIRGFEANRLLLVVDGVRMNNAIYRNGHLQNSMSLDMGGLDRIEIIYGPSSVIYGSDALGGVIHYYTKNPELAKDRNFNLSADAAAQYGSVNKSRIYHFGINAGFKKVAIYSGFTKSNFGDIRIGKNGDKFPANHGKVYSEITNINGRDTLIQANNPYKQHGTGYDQLDITQKILVTLGKNLSLTGNLQYSTSSNINRFDELYNFTNNKPTYASWYYGPQKRFFSSVKLSSEKRTLLFNDFRAIIAYQKIDEDRINRKFNRTNELHQEEDVKVYSANLDFRKGFSAQHKLEYGFEANYNDVKSEGYNIDVRNNAFSDALSRYPDKGSSISAISGYAGYNWIPSGKVRFSAGARYSHFFLNSKFSEAYDMIPFSTVDISTGALTGSGSIIIMPQKDLKVSLIFSTGYRAPNVDDYGKVRAKDREVNLPNDKLKPEYAHNGEIGIMKTFDGVISVGGNFYYTYLTNAIVNTYSSFNGNDSLYYNGDMYRIVANTNSAEAYITGIAVFFNADFMKSLQFKNTFNYTKGKDLSNGVPLGHIPPVFGRSSLSFEKSFFRSELFVYYYGRKSAKDYSPSGEDNLNYATDNGTPGWATFHYNIGASISENFRVQFSVENIFDTYYRSFASGVSAPGRNFIVTLKASI